MTEPEILDRLTILLGGRTAEEIAFSQISTGAQNDLERATEIARAMVVEYGMSEKLGPLSFGRDGFRSPDGRALFPGERPEMSDQTAQVVDEEVSRIVGEARGRARDIIGQKKDILQKLAGLLIVREVLEGKELKDFFEGGTPIPSSDEERRRLDAERADTDRKAEEERRAAVAATPPPGEPATESLPPPPHLQR